ncbi:MULTISPECIES: thioredoxin family protein [unclassified Enterococcus]|uniref:thioredoxin family protein n=1 Tax=unclassified Enterococcus TaxID=2608891 RepID=UPI001556E1F2|nr:MULTISPECIES: thioredoxin family protein [unclassified Enterococcus]MBS7577559.1 thioredoxin family protein [Enterococcus sp. MMGLQ5-2]MBS7584942.1 thioredoxin family protein [Enterococcus sp. MMGLQ5-1]NPD12797.1 thioredoxin family protein [Enterococcus sp. MMGLQ5-1]NPD37392.1 thioredoxin family protein [Enterococcus sp. MMGLQ5-2]
MIKPKSYEEIAQSIENGQNILFFTAAWCGDCRFIKPLMPEIEAEHPEFKFIEIDRDQFMDLAVKWDIFGIPSFVVIKDGKEIGRLVNKARKTKAEITKFIEELGVE